MRLDPNHIRAHIESLRHSYPDLFADCEDWELVLDSETNLDDLLNQLIAQERDAAAMTGAIATQIADLKARQCRYEQRSKVARDLMLRVMQTANVRKRELPAATLSIRSGSTRLAINDEASVPDNMCRFKREPDKEKIKEALLSGQTFNWAALICGDDGLTVRVK